MGHHDMVIDCLRHGACEGPSCLRGHTDVGLSKRGIQQYRALLDQLAAPDDILSSPLGRCTKGAQMLAQHFQCDYTLMPELAEMDFGEWDGVPLQQLHQRFPTELANFWQDPYRYPPPGSEPLTDFSQRCEQAWQQLVSHRQQRLLVVTHAGVLKSWIAARLGLERITSEYLATLHIDYASLVRFRVSFPAEDAQCPWVRLDYLGNPAGLETADAGLMGHDE